MEHDVEYGSDDILGIKPGTVMKCRCGTLFFFEDIFPASREVQVREGDWRAIRPVSDLHLPLMYVSGKCMFDGVP